MDSSKLFLPQHSVIVVVFKMQGCVACADYVPRFTAVASAKGLPVFNLAKGQLPTVAQLAATCLPIYVVDCYDKQFEDWADHLKASSMPVTFVLRRPRGKMVIEGAVPDAQIEWLLGKALRGLSCELDR